MNPSENDTPSSPSRRRILGWGGVGVLAGVAGYLGWPKRQEGVVGAGRQMKSGVESRPEPVYEALPGTLEGRNAFLPHIRSEFRIQTSEAAHATVCRLVRVGDEVLTEGWKGRFLGYSLLFAAPKEFVAESGMYHVTHPQMGSMDLFLSPVGQSDEVVHIEAVFSQKV